MVKELKLYLDQTFEETTGKSEQDFIKSGKDSFGFNPALSIFKERPHSFPLSIIKPRRTICLHVEGCPRSIELIKQKDKDGKERDALISDFGSLDDIRKFIAGQVAKSIGKAKQMTNIQVFLLAGLLIVVILLQVLGMRGFRIG